MAQAASVTRRYRFSAAHRLHADQLSDEENRRVFGKCNNPNGHGHNYVVYVTVGGPIDSVTGRSLDLEGLDRVVTERVVRRFDHQDLNRDPAFAATTTTGENLARLIWEILHEAIPDGKLAKVGVVETRDNSFDYAGPSSSR